MHRLVIRCLACHKSWSLEMAFTVYEQQALEATPCPGCGAVTLACAEPPVPRRSRRAARVLGQRTPTSEGGRG